MKIYKKEDVFEAALARIRFIFDEFEEIIVPFSGGKDSTVALELTLIVAREKNRLPVKVMWIDQEAELQSTEDYCKEVFSREEVEPYWMQIPFKLNNSSSFLEQWLYCFDPNERDRWIRPYSDISFKEQHCKAIFGEVDSFTLEFNSLFNYIYDWIAKDKKTAVICGMKANENPARRIALTSNACYKNITWSVKANNNFRFSPLYDWSNEDIFIAIANNEWKYNKFYDSLFQYGVPVNKMRVSSVIHETSAEWWLTKIQEIEPKTYEKLLKRISGVNTYSILGKDVRVHELPSNFSSWEVYGKYLINNLIPPDKRSKFIPYLEDEDVKVMLKVLPEMKIKYFKSICQAILANDFIGTKFKNERNSLTLKYINKTKRNY